MLEILGTLFGLVKTWVEGRQAISQAEIATKLAVETNRARLAIDKETHNSEWEQAELLQTDKWMRRACFIIFSAPFIIAIFAPDAVNTYFTIALQNIPKWFCYTYMSIVGAIWGVSALKNPIQSIFH